MTVATATPDPTVTAAVLDHLAIVSVRGADAVAFLDSQLTRDVPATGAAVAGYCSPKGRLLATFTLWRERENVHMLVSRDIAAAIAKRLRMYVLRAKATIDDAGTVGVVSATIGSRTGMEAPGSVAVTDEATWIRVADADGQARHLCVAAVPAPDAVASSLWRWSEIRAGLPRITAATQDRFVPQMLNFEALGGVDFKKGCFPGQEVVARSQYLGKLKRRMALARLDAGAPVPPAGADVCSPGGTEAVGLVVNAERGPDGRVALLAELPVALMQSDDLRAETLDGAPLVIEPLPYVLPDNEVFVRPKL